MWLWRTGTADPEGERRGNGRVDGSECPRTGPARSPVSAAGSELSPSMPWSQRAVLTVLGVALVGATPGHLIAGTRVATLGPADRSPLVGFWALPRTVLIALVIPPFILDGDGRGLHDRLCHTIVVRTR
jgi:uncharacterized RDD family membrane protein YckC